MQKLVVVVGETASGKSSLGMEIARQHNGEIIAADSRTIYKHFDIASAKPSIEDRAEIPHHMIDIIEPNQRYCAAQYKYEVEKKLQQIWENGHLPVMVGGTGLYVNSVIFDYKFGQKSSAKYREELESMSDEALVAIANDRGPHGINLKNRRHVIRFLETGHTPKQDLVLKENTLVLGISRPKNEQRKRIEKRVDAMFRQGLRKEVDRLVADYGWENQAIGGRIAQLFKSYQAGDISMSEVKRRFVTKDMQYAKRQRTWFKRNPHIQWFDNAEDALKAVSVFMHD